MGARVHEYHLERGATPSVGHGCKVRRRESIWHSILACLNIFDTGQILGRMSISVIVFEAGRPIAGPLIDLTSKNWIALKTTVGQFFRVWQL